MFTPKKITVAILSLTTLPSFASTTQIPAIEISVSSETTQQETSSKNELSQNSNSETGTSLRQIVGVDAARMGGHGVDLVIRGQQASQLNILMDGAKIEGGCPNRMDPPTSYAEMSSYDEITVIKGINSVTYGTGGTGGTVLFERNAPSFSEEKNYKGEINIGGGNNGLTRDLNASVAAGSSKGFVVVQASQKSADNYLDGNGNEVRSSYNSNQAHIDLGWTPDANNEFGLSYENTQTEDALFQGAQMDSPLSDGATTRLNYVGYQVTENIDELEVTFYHSDVDHIMDGATNPSPSMMKNITDVTSRGAKIQASSLIDQTTLDFGVQFEGVDKLSDLRNPAGATMWYMWPGVETETRSIFAETTHKLDKQQKIIFGLRYENYQTNASLANVDANGGMPGGVASALYTSTYTNYSGQTATDQTNLNSLLRFERDYGKGLAMFAALSQTHRSPDATELYAANGMNNWVGNPDLKPEQHNQIDLGMSKTYSKASWQVSAYFDKVNNYILRDNSSYQTTETLVAGRSVYLNKDATLFGVEASANAQLTSTVQVGANINYSRGSNDTDNRNLSNIAPISGNVYASYQALSWDAGMRFNFADNQTEVNNLFGELETAGWHTIDLFANYQFEKNITLSSGIDNLMNHAYQNYMNRTDSVGTSYKVYEPGQTIWAKLNVSF